MREFIVGTLLCGLRARSLQVVFVLGLLLMGLALLAGNFSARQPQTVVLDVGLSCLRFSLVLLAIFWVQELVAREIDRRTVIFALTYPVARHTYLLGRYVGILILLLAATLLLALLLGMAVVFAGKSYDAMFGVSMDLPYWMTVFGIWLDVAVVAAFTMWLASVSTISVLPLGVGLAFAIAGRAMGGVFQYLKSGADGDATMANTYLPVFNIAQWILPDLSRLDWRVWTMYGKSPGMEVVFWAVVMGLAYIAIMLWLAAHAFSRREFS